MRPEIHALPHSARFGLAQKIWDVQCALKLVPNRPSPKLAPTALKGTRLGDLADRPKKIEKVVSQDLQSRNKPKKEKEKPAPAEVCLSPSAAFPKPRRALQMAIRG